MNTDSVVKQDSFPSYGEDVGGRLRLNRRGELVVNDFLQQAAIDGRCFNIALATPDTTASASTSYVATDPAIIFTVPTGTTVIPYHLNVCLEDAAGTDNYIIVGCDTADLYTSGGRAASTANNLRSDSPHTSNVGDIYEGDTAIVMVDPAAGERTLWSWCDPFVDAAGAHTGVVVWEPRVAPVLVGPATFYVHIYGSTAPEFSFSIQYVEIPTVNTT